MQFAPTNGDNSLRPGITSATRDASFLSMTEAEAKSQQLFLLEQIKLELEKTRTEQVRAEQAQVRAEQERVRAEQERQQREAAEAKLARLLEELRRRGENPEDLL